MLVGTEWIVEAYDCEPEKLRDLSLLQRLFSTIISDLKLKALNSVWHQFDGEKGVTGLVLLSESHLACHTYPEFKTATFNLYCCKSRPEWNWDEQLAELLGSGKVTVRRVNRGNEVEKKLQTFGDVSIRDRGYLPHWETEEGIYFVTFRLADSIPKRVLNELEFERETSLKALAAADRKLSIRDQHKIDKLFSDKIEAFLDDDSYGSCVFRNNQAAEIVADALKHFDGERYHLFAWCVMPNHVHVVFRQLKHHKLDEILHSWKSFTSNKINKLFNREGELWQREYYDRLIRSQTELENTIKYVANNPRKAGIENWRWVGVFGKYKSIAEVPLSS
jgi:S-adenosylmethionine decarboxylase proenzyme